jgi:UDP-glucose 4-epimerase
MEKPMSANDILSGKRLLITGGTGSLGKTLLRMVLSGRYGSPERIIIFSRDEAKQHQIRVALQHRPNATDDLMYANLASAVEFRIGDVRSVDSLIPVLRRADIVVNAAALKQVPICEYFPTEAVATNIDGAANIVRAIRNLEMRVETVVGISTDKAVKPINVMGMSKALQERIFISGNLDVPRTRFVVVRYGNVLASSGSVVPLFHHQIRSGGPVTLTTTDMTRFLLSLEDAVEVVMAAIASGRRGEILVPRAPSARMADLADVLIGSRPIRKRLIGIRPGEKVHEILISQEEVARVRQTGSYHAIGSMLPELQEAAPLVVTTLGSSLKEYSSAEDPISRDALAHLLTERGLMLDSPRLAQFEGELLA